jgi:DNA-binding HxlR family transcriptional regulator
MARSLEIIGERWTLLIVRDLLRGPRRFQDLAASLANVAPGILSRRLKLLEDRGVVTRRIYLERPPRAEYALTDSGIELREVVRSLTIWGAKHLPGERKLVHRDCNHAIEMAYRCAHCDQVLAPDDIEYRTEAAPRRRGTPRKAAVRSRRHSTGHKHSGKARA